MKLLVRFIINNIRTFVPLVLLLSKKNFSLEVTTSSSHSLSSTFFCFLKNFGPA